VCGALLLGLGAALAGGVRAGEPPAEGGEGTDAESVQRAPADTPNGSGVEQPVSRPGSPDPVESEDASDGVSPAGLEPLGGMDGGVELLFEDFGVVVTASRSKRSAAHASVPVSVLDADDIRYAGVREIPELFAFVPGVDALRVDRNRWAIGVHGLHQTFSDRTLLLLNGRNASNAVFGGFDLQRLPIFLHDIERIEVVRGPGGGAWGANAFNGVINIIEKSPRDTTGFFASQRVNELGDSKTDFRVGDAQDGFAWRISGEVEEFEDSDEPFLNDGTVIAPDSSRDFARTRKLAFDGVYDLGDRAELDFGLGYSHVERGDAPFLNFQLGRDERIDLFRAHTKVQLNPGGETTGYLQWHGTFQDVNRPSLWRYTAYDNAFEGQLDFSPAGAHDVTVGATARLVNLTISQPRPTDAIPSQAAAEQWVGAFVSDHWKIADRWSLDSQARVDWYSETEIDWAGRIALFREFGPKKRHVLRVAGAKSFRTPQAAVRELSSQRVPIPGGPPPLFGLNLQPPDEIDNEQIFSAEIGYSGRLRRGLTLRVDAYLQHYDDLTGSILLPEPPPMVGRTFATLATLGGADAHGLEGEIAYERGPYAISAWYAYNEFDFDEPGQNPRAFRPAPHKVGLSARARPAEWVTANANYRYTDSTPGDLVSDVGATHRLDLTATFTPPRTHTEIQIGVLDVFDETDRVVFDQAAAGAGHRTPGRSFFVQVEVRF